MSNNRQPTQLLTRKQLQDLLGVKRAVATRLIKSGEFPGAAMVGNGFRVPVADVEAYLERNRVNPSKPEPTEGSSN